MINVYAPNDLTRSPCTILGGSDDTVGGKASPPAHLAGDFNLVEDPLDRAAARADNTAATATLQVVCLSEPPRSSILLQKSEDQPRTCLGYAERGQQEGNVRYEPVDEMQTPRYQTAGASTSLQSDSWRLPNRPVLGRHA